MELITAFAPYYIGVLMLAIIFGFTAQRSAFCPVGGLRDWVNHNQLTRLATYFAAIGIAISLAALGEGVGLFDLSQTIPPYRSAEFAWGRYLIGGFIFGFGMVLASGCGMRNLIRFGQGSYKALWLVLLMALMSYLMTRTSFYADWILPLVAPLSLNVGERGAQDLASLLFGQAEQAEVYRWLLGLMIGLALLIGLYFKASFKQFKPMLTALIIGTVVVAGYALTGGGYADYMAEEASFMDVPPAGLGVQSFTFAAPMGDLVHWASQPQWALVSFGVVAIVGLALGAFISAISQGEFKVEGFASRKEFVISSVGALLVGFGAVLAMGCSIGHGLSGTATLALGSFLALVSILSGAYVGIRLEKNWQ